MATETGNGLGDHVRGVTVTTIATVFGLAGGAVSAIVASGPSDTLGVLVLGAVTAVQFPLFRVLGIDVADFSTKDYLYVGFMTFTLWFISWGLLLTADAFQ